MNGGITSAIPDYAEFVVAKDVQTFRLLRTVAAYVTFVLLPAAGLFWILRTGNALLPPVTATAVAATDSLPGSQIILRTPIFLTQIIIIIAAARLVGSVLRKLGQPRVVGEMLAGLMLGPSLLGAVAPAAYAWLFPVGTVRFLSALSQTGIVLFMFLIGLELNVREIVRRSRESFVVSHASIAVPMFAGGALAFVFYRQFAIAGMPFPTFALFLGCAMSITAFPVLARILRDSSLANSAFGSMAIGCAALADVSAWIILAFVISLAHGNAVGIAALGHTAIGIALYLLVMTTVVRKFLKMICRGRASSEARSDALTQNQLGIVLLVVLASAVTTELLHIHAIFGAFIAGVVMPKNEGMNETIRKRFGDLLSILLLPLFFAYAGLRTNVGAIATLSNWLACGAIIGVAVFSKIGGCLAAGRATGMSWRTAGALGVLMNARGLMELVLLTIGLQLGIITPLLFTIMVIMAIATTLMAAPLFTRLMARQNDIGALSRS